MSQTGIEILVATHKPYRMPEDGAYLPVQVGAVGKPPVPGCVADDAGDSISARNPNFCELTGLYWAWKNRWRAASPDADPVWVGLVHYRRHFRGKRGIATGDEIRAALEGIDAILPKKRNYFIETNRSQYVHAHHAEDLDETRRILEERHPAYVAAFDKSMELRSGHRFNMFVMRKGLADRYCEWLFGILFELERRLDISSYSAYDARVFGFVAERLFDVWLDTERVSFRELPVMNLESQHWPRKIVNFLKRKFTRRK